MARIGNVAVVALQNGWTLKRHREWHGSGYYADAGSEPENAVALIDDRSYLLFCYCCWLFEACRRGPVVKVSQLLTTT
jgi:hypothetical protein